MTENKLVDHKARQSAIDPSRSFIVQAPAGSGKTGLLIQRYLALLTVVDKPEEILAITFTRKAASEMRERILSVLTVVNEGLDDADVSEHEQQSRELAKKVCSRDAEKSWGLLKNPNRMQILTIDAFCTRLVAAMPVASRFGGVPKLLDDSQEVYQLAVDRYFKDFLSSNGGDQSLETVLLQFNNDFERVSDLLIRLLAKRDQWLPYVSNEGLINTGQLNEALAAAIEQDLKPLTCLLNADINAEIVAMASYAAESLHIEGVQSDVLACQNLNALPEARLSELNIWRGIKKLLLTDAGKLRKSVTKREGFLAASSSDNPDIRMRYKQCKERMLELLTRLEAEDDFLKRLQTVSDLPTKTYTVDDQELLSALFRVLKSITAELMVEFQLNSQIDFIELTSSALRSLGYDQEPTDLALVFDAKIKHILIDEFQDTSKLHLELLRKLTLGWQEGDGRSLFVVGDPMQSIYKFRDANVANFINLKRNGINALQLEHLQLDSNFRSDQNVVDLNNQVFKDVFTKNDDFDSGEVAFHPAHAIKDNNGNVAITMHVMSDKSLATEAQNIITLLSEIQAADSETTIGILVRSRKHLENIIPALRVHGLVSSIDGMEKLSTRQEVLDVYSLCMALVNPADDQTWLSVLRAPWCGLALPELEIIIEADRSKLVFENLRDESVLAQLSIDSCERIECLLKAYDLAFSMLYKDQLGVIVEGLWKNLHGYACMESVEQVINVEKFFSILRTQTISSTLSMSKPLANHLKGFTKPSATEIDGNIQVLTIHMAKGLEFDHVILPSASRTTKNNESDLLVWQEITDIEKNDHLLLAAKQTSGDSGLYKYIQKRHKRLDDAELKRLFYVAMTRSVKSTHVFCVDNSNGKQSQNKIVSPQGSFAALLESNLDVLEIKKYALESESQTAKNEVTFLRQRLISATQKEPVENNITIGGKLHADKLAEVIEYEWASETAMHVGTVVHLALKQLGTKQKNDWLTASHDSMKQHFTRVLRALGVSDFELEEAVEKTVTAISTASADKQRAWIFSSSHTEVENEYPVSGFIDGDYRNFRIDRTFVDSDNIRWIIDYKTSSHEGGALDDFLDNEVVRYKNQLDSYAEIMQNIDGRDIKLGLYFPLMQAWREWQYVTK